MRFSIQLYTYSEYLATPIVLYECKGPRSLNSKHLGNFSPVLNVPFS